MLQDVERDDMEFCQQTLKCPIVATLEEFDEKKVVKIQEMRVEDGVTYLLTSEESKTCTFIVRGANKLILDEAERSVHDAMCSIRSLVKRPFLVPGGASVEIEIA